MSATARLSFRRSRRPRACCGFTLLEIMVVVFIVGVLLGIAIPSFRHARDRSSARACVSNLLKSQLAKQMWAMDNNKGATTTVYKEDLVPEYLKKLPQCPSGGTYTLESVTNDTHCSEVGEHHID